jgi:hypothetical protein
LTTRTISLLLTFIFCYGGKSFCQDSTAVYDIPTKHLKQIEAKIDALNTSLDKEANIFIDDFYTTEKNIQKKLQTLDSPAALITTGQLPKFNIDEIKAKFKIDAISLKNAMPTDYLAGLDSLDGSFNFLTKNEQYLKKLDATKLAELKLLKEKIDILKGKLNAAEKLKLALNKRRQALEQALPIASFKKELHQLKTKVATYKNSVDETKQLLKSPDKLQKKLLALLQQTSAFKKFMQQYSFLAQLFPQSNAASTATGVGLQTRASINQIMQQQFAANGSSNPGAFIQQQAGSAKEQLNTLKNKVNTLAGGDGEIDMPNYVPKTNKLKSFLKKLEYGVNFQFNKANNLIPSGSDIGLSLGYKISKSGFVGIAGQYKLGLGTGIQDIKFTHEGVGYRTFVDWKLKGKTYISGGWERSYHANFKTFRDITDMQAWQTSALLGFSKRYQISKKVKGNFQLLYNFLHHKQSTTGQALVVRVGYIFK